MVAPSLPITHIDIEDRSIVQFYCVANMASNSHQEPWLLENGNLKSLNKEMRHGRTAHNMSSSSLRKKSDLTLVAKVRIGCLRQLLTNLQEVILGTKLSVLFPAIPLAIVAECYGFGRVSFLLLVLT